VDGSIHRKGKKEQKEEFVRREGRKVRAQDATGINLLTKAGAGRVRIRTKRKHAFREGKKGKTGQRL